jgi:hypothetical protein
MKNQGLLQKFSRQQQATHKPAFSTLYVYYFALETELHLAPANKLLYFIGWISITLVRMPSAFCKWPERECPKKTLSSTTHTPLQCCAVEMQKY